MDDPFPASDFDDWAETYDGSVASDRFPFIGYPEVLARAVALADAHPGHRVLDLGTGTGNLAQLLARQGCDLWCIDFSVPMLAKARTKLAGAHFALHDLHAPLPAEFGGPFDRIVSAYVFHHFDLEDKVRILSGLLPHLAAGGRIVIADIAFKDADDLHRVELAAGDEWEQEYYWLAGETLPALSKAGLAARFEQISSCAGVFAIAGDL